jgi:hypothetical protein
MKYKMGQKWYQPRGLPLIMCRQGGFYIFNQAPSFNLQKFIRQHVIGKNWRFFVIWAINICFSPLTKINVLRVPMPGMSMSCTPR